jgi:xanthine dehydrogenase molybdenum-binding subunit
MACEETGLPPETFDCRVDTSEELDCGQTTASRATVLAGHAVRDAAQKLNEELQGGKSLDQLIGRKFYGLWACPPTDPLDSPKPEPKTHLTYGWATQVVMLDEEGRLRKVIAAHDVGRAFNSKGRWRGQSTWDWGMR